MRIGAVEAGGTKFIIGVGNEEGVIEDRISIPTRMPEETIPHVIEYFKDKQVEAIGIGSFGPLGVDKNNSNYGHVTTTPKPGWNGYNFLGVLQEAYDVPFGWDTDVNAAAYGESIWGAARGLKSCVYYTVGTGIGVGVYSQGRLVHGLVHPEGGHVLTRRHPNDNYVGNCPYHNDCFEGMAAGPAIEKRWQMKGSDIPKDHAAWEMEAFYLGQSIANTILMVSPEKVILGGGVMKQEQLFPLIRAEVRKNLNGYVSAKELLEGLDDYIVAPGLGDNAGLAGSLALGIAALRKQEV